MQRHRKLDTDVRAWLLEEENPSIKYLTLTRLLGVGGGSSRVQSARAGIPGWMPVRRILARQRPDGGWDTGRTWYLPKYKSTVWQLIVLSQTGIDPRLPPIRKMCEYSLEFQTPSGYFASGMGDSPGDDWGLHAGCLNGNVVASLCRLGMAREPQVRRAIEALIAIQEPDGGWSCRTFGYHRRDKHSCFMGTICALDALNEYAESRAGASIDRARKDACEFILVHELFRADHHGFSVIRPEWTKLGAPWLVGYNVLRGLRALTRAGIRSDERMDEALSVVESKRLGNGRWRRDSRWPSTAYSSFGQVGSEDKWTTLNAMLVLRALGQRDL